jgi:hypothetical protein
MRARLLAPSIALLVLAVTGCGSSSSSPSSSHAGSSAAKAMGALLIYRVALTGTAETPAGAPNGGAAVIAFHGSSVVCWRFAHLHAFTNATFARIDIGVQGKSGNIVVALSTGPRLHHQGCVPVSAKLVKTIEDHPRGYYVNIHSTTYPGGAVRVAGTPLVAVSVPVTIRTSRFTAGIFWTTHLADRPSADPTLLVLRGSVLYDRLQAYFDRLWWQSVPSSAEGQ